MAVDVWPVTLPQALLVDGYQDGVPEGRIKTPTDTGPGKSRRRTSAASRMITGRMLMTTEQLNTLRDFIETTTSGGSLPFSWREPINQDIKLTRFGDNLPTWFLAGSDTYDVALQFEVLP